MAWHEIGDEFLPPPSGPRPVTNDPRYPYISPAVARRTNTQSTYRIADLTNPILQPWAAEQMRKSNAAVLAGGVGFRPRERCLPAGVPEFAFYARVEPFYFLQTPREVTILNSGGPEVRHVFTKTYVDDFRTPHSEKLHVVERFKMSADRRTMEDFITVDDPGAFTRQWSGIQRFELVEWPLKESVCAENNENFFHYAVAAMPEAGKPDF